MRQPAGRPGSPATTRGLAERWAARRLAQQRPSHTETTARLPLVGSTQATLGIEPPRRLLRAIGFALAVAGALILGVVLAQVVSQHRAAGRLTEARNPDVTPAPLTVFSVSPSPSPSAKLGAAGPSPATVGASDASGTPFGPATMDGARLRIPAIRVDAPVVVKGLDEHKVMEAPDEPLDVAWYDFTSPPGTGGNAVFSGHVDFANVGPAVFWKLRDLQQGDTIQVLMSDGAVYTYKVTSKTLYDEATAPVDQIVGPSAAESITLITCAGTFNHATGRYDARLIVRAERV